MILRDNPVLIRELLVNLRSPRAFVLQFLYVAFLGVMVYFAWPRTESQVSSGAAQRLFDLFFLGQFFLVALTAPTFAAGSITGEKERKTYEMLLASPLQPTSILVGKLLSSLTYLILLIISSLPLIILCFLLGGILMSEIVRAYLILILAAGTFGLLSLACSSYFGRTSSALVVSYLVILPLAIICIVLTRTQDTNLRDFVSIAVLPPWCLTIWAVVVVALNGRLLRPPDVGSEGKEVVDEEQEMKYAIGVVIDRDLFPDKLFAPAKRTDLMPDGTNPVLDKELRSEIFSQGTLMLRVVIQVSMLLSIPLMAVLLFLRPENAGYYVSYVLTFNLLVGPVFSSGSITQERERQTLNLLLTTLLRPGKIVWAKLLAALRVSTVLTFLLTEQLLLAYILIPELRDRPWTLIVYLLIIATTCLATSTIGLLCSALSRRTSAAMVLTYMALLILFVGPIGLRWYLQGFAGGISEERIAAFTVSSPFSAAFSLPMKPSNLGPNQAVDLSMQVIPGLGLPVWAAFLGLYPPLCLILFGATYLAFRYRWWKAGGDVTMKRRTIGLGYAMEMVLAAAIAFALVRMNHLFPSYLGDRGRGWAIVFCGSLLTGLVLAANAGLVAEMIRGRRPGAWGMGRWIWSISGLYLLFDGISTIARDEVGRLVWNARGPRGITLGDYAQQVAILVWFQGFAWAMVAVCATSIIAKIPRDPEPDARERTGWLLPGVLVTANVATWFI